MHLVYARAFFMMSSAMNAQKNETKIQKKRVSLH